jgi:hypothetical protein
MGANLQGEVVPFTNVPRQFDNSLHALNLALDIRVEVYLLDFWEAQKVNRTRVPSRWILGDELS